MPESKNKHFSVREKMLKLAALFATFLPNTTAAEEVFPDTPDKPIKVNVSTPTRNIDFQVDTVSSSNTSAVYSPVRNTITIQYEKIEGKNYNLPEDYLAMNAIHEQKHRDNQKEGLFSFPINPDQAYKLDMHNEISANIAELIYIRDKYLKTHDKDILNISSKFDFYRNAVVNGEIVPGSPYREDFDKEMKLIVNGMKKVWEERFKDNYSTQSSNSALTSDISGRYSAFHEDNYQRALTIAYTIGGVDFSRYMDKDINISPTELGRKMLDYKLLQLYNYPRNLSNEEVCIRFDLPKYDENLTLEEYRNLLRHAFVLKQMDYSKDTSQDMLNSVAKELSEQKITAKIAQEKYRTALQKTEEIFNPALDAIIDRLASDYSQNNKTFPKKSKNKGNYYRNALNNLYTAHIATNISTQDINLLSILNPDEQMPFEDQYSPKISRYIKAEQNTAIYTAGLTSSNYRKWQNNDGERVSAVQYIETIDTSKDCIEQPSKSYIEDAKENIKNYIQAPEKLLSMYKTPNGR